MDAQEIAVQEKSKEAQKFIARVYGWMAAALILSGFCAWYTTVNPAIFNLVWGTKYGIYIMMGLELGLVFIISLAIKKLSVFMASLLFILYSIVNGVTLSSIFLVFDITSIGNCFFIAAAMFAVMSVYGYITKSDLTSFGRYFSMALIGLIIASLVNFFLKSEKFDWILSIVSIIIFTGLTAYDTQKITKASAYADGSDVFKKAAIIGALEIYLDFINIFLNLLRLFGKSKR